MGVGDEQRGDEIVLFRRHAGKALAAAPLRPVVGQRRALDIALMGDGDDHVLPLDQVLIVDIAVIFDDLGPARRGEFLFHLSQFSGDDRHDPLA